MTSSPETCRKIELDWWRWQWPRRCRKTIGAGSNSFSNCTRERTSRSPFRRSGEELPRTWLELLGETEDRVPEVDARDGSGGRATNQVESRGRQATGLVVLAICFFRAAGREREREREREKYNHGGTEVGAISSAVFRQPSFVSRLPSCNLLRLLLPSDADSTRDRLRGDRRSTSRRALASSLHDSSPSRNRRGPIRNPDAEPRT